MVKQSNKKKLISPTKETYLTSRTSNVKFGENLQSFKNNVPMYLSDMSREDHREEICAI